MDYIQALFSFFNAPLFATFIIGMFWKRMTPWAGFWGLVAGTSAPPRAHYGNSWASISLGSAQAAAFWGAIAAFVADAIVSVGVSLFTQPKPDRGAAGPRPRHGQRSRGATPGGAGLVPQAVRRSRSARWASTVVLSIVFW